MPSSPISTRSPALFQSVVGPCRATPGAIRGLEARFKPLVYIPSFIIDNPPFVRRGSRAVKGINCNLTALPSKVRILPLPSYRTGRLERGWIVKASSEYQRQAVRVSSPIQAGVLNGRA